MGWQIVWTEPALAAFEEAILYIMKKDEDAAEKTRVAILDCVDRLVQFPHSGPRYESDPTGRSREVLCLPYRIFYRLDESVKRIEILTVWHGSRREPHLDQAQD